MAIDCIFVYFILFLTFSTIFHVSTTNITKESDSLMTEKLIQLENILKDVISQLNDLETKNKELESKNQELENKLRSKMEDIDDDLRKHITSSEIHFNVIEQTFQEHLETFADYNTSSSDHFAQIETSMVEHITKSDAKFAASESNFASMQKNFTDHLAISENKFERVEEKVDANLDLVLKEITNINESLPNLPGKWSGGSYCIFANGECPKGFARYEKDT